MSKAHLIITAITVQGLSYRQVAKRYGVSKSWAHTLHQRYLAEGDKAFEPRSSRPHHSPTTTPEPVRQRIIELRHTLTTKGFDAGAHTIAYHLTQDNIHISPTTIWRILKATGCVTEQPQKRPRSSYQFFTAPQPNSLWQSDFTHWDTHYLNCEIIGWIDDHSRYLLHLSAHRRITGKTVTDTFNDTINHYGPPHSTLTDNGMVFTTRFAGGGHGRGRENAFETLLAIEGIIQKNGRPYKPTTQGKIERVWKTMKIFLQRHHNIRSIPALQKHLNTFRNYYNTVRPHSSIGRNTPITAYQLLPKATPGGTGESIWKVRYDRVNEGKITLRYGNKMLHLGIGRTHEKQDVIALIKDKEVTILDPQGTILGEYLIDPNRNYQAKK